MFDVQELYEETGIDNTWRNHCDSKRIAVQLEKQCMYMRYKCKVDAKLKQLRNSGKQLSDELEILD